MVELGSTKSIGNYTFRIKSALRREYGIRLSSKVITFVIRLFWRNLWTCMSYSEEIYIDGYFELRPSMRDLRSTGLGMKKGDDIRKLNKKMKNQRDKLEKKRGI